MTGRVYVSFEGTLVSVASDIPDVTSWISFCFRAMIAGSSTRHAPVSALEINRTGNGYTLIRDGQTLLEVDNLNRVLQRTRHEVIQAHVDHRTDLLWLHAGAVALAAGAVLFVGPTGSGKSSLTGRLVEAGWSYLSDDIAPLHPDTLAVHPYPLTPFAREYTGEALDTGVPVSLAKVSIDIPHGRYTDSPSPVVAVIFPVYDPTSPGLSPVPAGPATLRLLAQGINTRDLGETAVRTVTDLLRHASPFELRYVHPAHAANTLLEHLDTP